MNDDIYAEWIVKRKRPGYYYPAIIGMILGIIVSMYLVFVSVWFLLVFAGAVMGTYFGRRFLKIEYEYIFVTNELAIDVVYSQTYRKRKRKIEMSQMEYVEPTNEERNRNFMEGGTLKLEDYSSHAPEAKTWTIRCNDQGQQYLIIFEPNDKMLHAMWRAAPGKVQRQ